MASKRDVFVALDSVVNNTLSRGVATHEATHGLDMGADITCCPTPLRQQVGNNTYVLPNVLPNFGVGQHVFAEAK